MILENPGFMQVLVYWNLHNGSLYSAQGIFLCYLFGVLTSQWTDPLSKEPYCKMSVQDLRNFLN